MLEELLPLHLAAQAAWPTATDEEKKQLTDPMRVALESIKAQQTPEEQAEENAERLRMIYEHPEYVLEEHRVELMTAATGQRLSDLLTELATAPEADKGALLREMEKVNLEYIALRYPST